MKTEENQLVSFKLSSEEYGVDIGKVREIIKVPDITRVPRSPYFVEGVVNLRGNILPVVDTRKRFDMSPSEKNGSSRIVVVNTNGMTLGLIVDSVSEVLRVHSQDIAPPPPIIACSNAEYLQGICKLNKGNRLISLLDLDKFLETGGNGFENGGSQRRGFLDKDMDVFNQKKIRDETQFVIFQLGAEKYAIDIELVEEIIRIPPITSIPNTPHYIKGVINLRENILPVVSLRLRFSMEDAEGNDLSRIIVVRAVTHRCWEEKNCSYTQCPAYNSSIYECWKVPGTFCGGKQQCDMETKRSKCRDCSFKKRMTSFGIIVDRVNEVQDVPNNLIEPPPGIIMGDNSSYLRGVGKMGRNKGLLLILNTGKIIESYMNSMGTFADSQEEHHWDFPEKIKGEKNMDDYQLVTFRIGKEEFGINIMNVQEIIRMTEITSIPGSPYFVEGLVNLRGGVLPVINLRKRFEMDDDGGRDSNRIVVVTYKGSATGIVVDSVSEVLHLSKKDVEPPPPVVSGINVGFIKNIGKLQKGKRFIIILDLPAVLNMGGDEEVQEEIEESHATEELFSPVAKATPSPLPPVEEDLRVMPDEEEDAHSSASEDSTPADLQSEIDDELALMMEEEFRLMEMAQEDEKTQTFVTEELPVETSTKNKAKTSKTKKKTAV